MGGTGNLTWSHLISIGLTWSHMVSHDLTWSHLVSLGLTWFHLVSLGFNWSVRCRSQDLKGYTVDLNKGIGVEELIGN